VINLATLCIARSHLCSIGDQDVDTIDFSLKNGNERPILKLNIYPTFRDIRADHLQTWYHKL
jgi:hypothetical protein